MTSNDRAAYRDQGFLVKHGLFSDVEIAHLIAAATELCRDHAESLGRSHRLETAAATTPSSLTEDELLARVLAIHFPHKLSPEFRTVVCHPKVVDVLGEIIGPNVKCMQSMLFIKQSGKPGQAWHQDENFIPTRDRSLTGVWIALDPATVENGCLSVIPGSHRPGVIYPSRDHNNPDYDSAPEAFDFPHDPTNATVVEIAPGDVIFFNGYLLHGSTKNRAAPGTYRRALVNHCMSAESLLPWTCGNQIEPTQDNRDIIIVRGEDPYAWKGVQDNAKPYVRTESRVG